MFIFSYFSCMLLSLYFYIFLGYNPLDWDSGSENFSLQVASSYLIQCDF